MSKLPCPSLDDLEDQALAVAQRGRLKQVRLFLDEHGAASALLDAIDEALEDIERWIDPQFEAMPPTPSGLS